MNLEDKESFHTIKPVAEELRGKIAYYYFHQTHDPTFYRSFSYYPNFRIAINVFKDSKISWNKSSRTTSPSLTPSFTSILTFTRDRERKVFMNGLINKIGVVFEPLGINHFADKPMEVLLKETISHFNEFGVPFHEVCKQIFESENIDLKRNLLDDYFLSNLKKIDNPPIFSAINTIMERKGVVGVEELASQLFMTRKSLLRLFKKYLCMTPKGFISLVKFRNSIHYFKKFKSEINLTELAHQSQYYDQSSFIKHFYSVTGINPKKFFFELEDIGKQETIWNLDLDDGLT